MKRDVLRSEVAKHLASLGYAPGWFAWVRQGRKIVLAFYDGKTMQSDVRHIPSGKTSKKRLAEVLATIPACGAPRAYTAHAAKDDGGGVQLELAGTFGDRR